MRKSEALQQRKELLQLIEQWARAEIMARFGRFDNLEYLDYARIKLEKEDEIRQLVFGESELIVLADMWGLVKLKRDRKRRSKDV